MNEFSSQNSTWGDIFFDPEDGDKMEVPQELDGV